MAKKKEYYVTPVMSAVYPHLHAPDTKFDEDGVYSTKGRFTGVEAVEIIDFLNEQYAQAQTEAAEELHEAGKAKTLKAALAKVKAGPDPYTMELDEDGEETGAVIVNFKMRASGTSRKTGKRWSRRPRLFDAAGTPIPVGLKIGSGSRLRVQAEINRYYTAALGAGVSLRLNSVQVLELQTWGDVTAEAAGFDAVEGGFSVDDASEEAFAGDVAGVGAQAPLTQADPGADFGDDDGDF